MLYGKEETSFYVWLFSRYVGVDWLNNQPMSATSSAYLRESKIEEFRYSHLQSEIGAIRAEARIGVGGRALRNDKSNFIFFSLRAIKVIIFVFPPKWQTRR